LGVDVSATSHLPSDAEWSLVKSTIIAAIAGALFGLALALLFGS
jgi:hypothetical protein